MSPSEAAKIDQFNAQNYPGVDNWQDSNLHQGNIIYIWEAEGQASHGAGDAYAMTPETALGCDGDPNKLRDAIQTDIDPRFDLHRGRLQAYEINGEIPAAFSHCEANKCHGSGGGEQYFIPGFDDFVRSGDISKRDDLNLYFNESALPISPEEKADRNEALKAQPPEITPTPSQGTTATLEGAYIGTTPNLSSELKPQVDAAQQQWNTNHISNQVSGTPPPQDVSNSPTGPPGVSGELPPQTLSASSEKVGTTGVAGELPPAKPTESQPDNPIAGTLPPQHDSTSPSTSETVAGEPPQPPKEEPRHDDQIAGATPDKAQSIELPSDSATIAAGKGLAESGTKKSGENFDPNSGIT